MITWKTNRSIGRNEPLKYIKERSEISSEDIVKERLDSHLIPTNELATGGYENIDGDEKKNKIKSDFDQFLNKRAALIVKAAIDLTEGKEITAERILSTIN